MKRKMAHKGKTIKEKRKMSFNPNENNGGNSNFNNGGNSNFNNGGNSNFNNGDGGNFGGNQQKIESKITKDGDVIREINKGNLVAYIDINHQGILIPNCKIMKRKDGSGMFGTPSQIKTDKVDETGAPVYEIRNPFVGDENQRKEAYKAFCNYILKVYQEAK